MLSVIQFWVANPKKMGFIIKSAIELATLNPSLQSFKCIFNGIGVRARSRDLHLPYRWSGGEEMGSPCATCDHAFKKLIPDEPSATM